jgi:hypothetical protein
MNLLRSLRVRQLHRDASRRGIKALRKDTTEELLSGLPEAKRLDLEKKFPGALTDHCTSAPLLRRKVV